MRSLWLMTAVLGLAFSADAGADGMMYRVGSAPARPVQHAPVGSGWVRPGGVSSVGHDHDHDRDHGFRGGRDEFRHSRARYGYLLPSYAGPGYAGTDSTDDDSDRPDFDQAGYVPEFAQPGYFEPPMTGEEYAPRLPAPLVQYATSADPPIKIPPGAKVTKGSVYKYTKDGVNAYTDDPPPDSVPSKLLFGYTEVVTPASSPGR